VFRCVLGSEGCVLVPRSSGTLVATWAWPTLVVSRRRVLEAVFILLEFPSPSRRIFTGSHSLPPSLVRRIGPSPSTASGGAKGAFPGEPQREGQVAAPGQPRRRGRDHHTPHGCTPGRSRLFIRSGAPLCSLSTP
jgi:hypothetical protein